MIDVRDYGLEFFDYTFGSVGPCGAGFEFNVSIGYPFEGKDIDFIYPIVTDYTEEDSDECIKGKMLKALEQVSVEKIKEKLLVFTPPDTNTDDWFGDGVKNPKAVEAFVRDNLDAFEKAIADLKEIKGKLEN